MAGRARQAQARGIISGPDGRAAGALDEGRRAARGAARQGRRQGFVRQRARGGPGRRARRLRGAFDEGRSRRSACGVSACGHSRPRGSARCPDLGPFRLARGNAGGWRARHLEPAPRRTDCRALPRAADPDAARQRGDAPRKARSRRVRRDRSRRGRPEAARPGGAYSRPARACAQPAGCRTGCLGHRVPGRSAGDHPAGRAARGCRYRRLRALGGSCTVPLGAYAQVLRDRLRLQAVVAAPDGRRVARAEDEGTAGAPEQLGERVAALLRARGAGEILATLQASG
jgi:hypothetical protein